MSEDIIYADIKFSQSSSGKQSSKSEENGESGTEKQKATAKLEEAVTKQCGLGRSEPSIKNGVIIILCFLCFLLLSLSIAVTILYIQEIKGNNDCHIETKTLENNLNIVSQKISQLREAFCKNSNGTQCSLYPWGTSNISGWTTYFGNSIYFFSNEKLNWIDSRNACLLMMSNLVVINSKAEQVFLKNSAIITKKPYWIGFTDQAKEGKWCWVDDPACNTTNLTYWQKNQPDNYITENDNGENCATENYNDETWETWNDDLCLKLYSWICEKQMQTVFL